MRQIIYAIYAAILIFTVSSCGPSESEYAMHYAESIMELHPDSALMILSEIKSDYDQFTPHSKAKFDLLMTQSLVKTDHSEIDIYPIINACDYFTKKNEQHDKMKSLFYKAYLSRLQNHFDEAMDAAVYSYDLSCSLHDSYWRAKCTELLADLFTDKFNYKEALKYRIETVRYYKESDKDLNALYSVVDLATTYGHMRAYEKSLHLIDSVSLLNRETCQDPNLSGFCYSALLPIYYFTDRYSEFNQTYDSVAKYWGENSYTIDDYLYKAVIEARSGNIDKALTAFRNAERFNANIEKKGHFFVAMGDYYRSIRDKDNALKMMDSAFLYQDKALYDAIINTGVNSQRTFYSNKADERQRRINIFQLMIIIICALSIMIIITLALISRYRIKLKNADIESKIGTILILREQLKETSESDSNKDKKLSEMFRSQWALFNRLCGEYINEEDSSKARQKLVSEISAEIKNLQSPASLRIIENNLNEYMGNIVSMLREECPKLKEDEISLFTLYLAGFKPKTISLLLNLNYKYFAVKKSRLIDKIRSSSANHEELFVTQLNSRK